MTDQYCVMIGSTVTEAPSADEAVSFLCSHMTCEQEDVTRQMRLNDNAEAVYGYVRGHIYTNPCWLAEQEQPKEEAQSDLNEKIDYAYRLGYEDAKRDMLAKLDEMKN